MRGASDRDSIGELFRRLADEARTLAKAELALFRTDFYRRVGKAKLGILLCLVGAIMGQAAAVTFLVTLSFVLTPWIGRLGGAAVSVVLGIGLAVALLRIGAQKLTLVLGDEEDANDDAPPIDKISIDQLFERVRARSRAARDQLADTLGETQARLHPQALIADLADEIADHAQTIAHKVIGVVRVRPYKLGAAAFLASLIIFRTPLARIVDRISRETVSGTASLKRKRAPRPRNEETPS